MSLNILMLLFNPVGKGTYWRALSLGRGLARRGHAITLMATSRDRRLHFDTKPDTEAGVTLVETPDLLWGSLRSGWDPWNATARVRWAQRHQFDLIHGFESRPTVIVPALYWQRRRHRPMVLDWCDWFGSGGSVEERPNPLLRLILRPMETVFENTFRTWADGTTVINSFLRRRALGRGVAPETILELPNGSNVEEIRPIPKSEARIALGWPESALVIGYIGAIFQRDALLMAQAFDQIRQAEPKAQLLLAGYCNVAVEQLVAEPAGVVRTGPIRYDEINCYLAACDICWLPLRDRGANRGRYPLKINDYMAAGRPVVATEVGDVADLVRRGRFGLLSADSPDDLAQRALELLGDPARRKEMGQRARHVAETEFQWDHICSRLEQFYYRVLEGTLS